LSVFEQVARIYDGWIDPDTGLRVLQIRRRGEVADGDAWSTLYHQYPCFLEGGRKVLLQRLDCPVDRPETFFLDLATGRTQTPFPAGTRIREVCERTGVATLIQRKGGESRAIIWDLRAKRGLASLEAPGWVFNSINLLSDGRRAIVYAHKGWPYKDKMLSRHWLIGPGLEPRLLLDADGWHTSHVQICPTDPELYAYDN
jgi:hypothetical protein